MPKYSAPPPLEANLGKRPTARRFFDAVVRVLAHRSEYTLTPLPKSRSLEVQILGVGGIDPCLPMPKDWFLDPAKPKGRAIGLLRVVQFAFRNQRGGEHYRKDPSKVYCVFYPRTPEHPDGLWGLTEVGLARANELRAELGPPGANWTTLHMNRLIHPLAADEVQQWLGRKLAKSHTLGQIRDHFHNYLTRMMETDGWFKTLYAGRPPTLSHVKGWAYKQACSDLEGNGRNPAARSLHGASTARDRAGTRQPPLPATGSQVLAMGQDSDGGDQVFARRSHRAGSGAILDVVATRDIGACTRVTAEGPDGFMGFSDALDGLAYAQGMERVEAAIRRYKPTVWERYLRVVNTLQEGGTVRDVAAGEEVSRNRGANIVATAREALRVSQADGLTAISVLHYCDIEPYSTRNDIHEDVEPKLDSSDGALDIVIEWHLERGNLDEREGGSFLITPAGRAMMRSAEADPKLVFLT